jgi:hypothetical protein
MITKASSYTVTFNGPFEAGQFQVFSGFSPGDVTFGTGAASEAYAEWWGIEDGKDTTYSIQSSLSSGAPEVTAIPGRTYNISGVYGTIEGAARWH